MSQQPSGAAFCMVPRAENARLPGWVQFGDGLSSPGGFLAELGKHADHITTLDIDADQQRLAKPHVRQAGARCPIRYVIQDAQRLPWTDASFDSAVSVNT